QRSPTVNLETALESPRRHRIAPAGSARRNRDAGQLSPIGGVMLMARSLTGGGAMTKTREASPFGGHSCIVAARSPWGVGRIHTKVCVPMRVRHSGSAKAADQKPPLM